MIGFGVCVGGVLWLGLLEFVCLAPEFNLDVCVFIEFGEWEVPVGGCFLSEGVGYVCGWGSVGWVSWLWCGIPVCHQEFLE